MYVALQKSTGAGACVAAPMNRESSSIVSDVNVRVTSRNRRRLTSSMIFLAR